MITMKEFLEVDSFSENDIERAILARINSELFFLALCRDKRKARSEKSGNSTNITDITLTFRVPSARINISRISRRVQDKLIEAGWSEGSDEKHGVKITGSKIVSLRETKCKFNLKFQS